MSSDPHNLQRFIDAQDGIFETALAELKSGSKQRHWMWFIFPQLAGLGRSPNAHYYALRSIDEARAYLAHPLLGPRLRQAVEALLPWAGKRTPDEMLGAADALKLRSSLTVFDIAEPNSLFRRGLVLLFGAEPDQRTLALLNGPR